MRIKNNLKKTVQVSAGGGAIPNQSVVKVKRSSSSLNIANVPRLVVSSAQQDNLATSADSNTNNAVAFSMPNQAYLRTNRKSIRPGRLRPNNILIEQDAEEAAATSTDANVDDTDESNDEKRRFLEFNKNKLKTHE